MKDTLFKSIEKLGFRVRVSVRVSYHSSISVDRPMHQLVTPIKMCTIRTLGSTSFVHGNNFTTNFCNSKFSSNTNHTKAYLLKTDVFNVTDQPPPPHTLDTHATVQLWTCNIIKILHIFAPRRQQYSNMSDHHTYSTRSSAIAEGPRNVPCQLKPCQRSHKCSSNCI